MSVNYSELSNDELIATYEDGAVALQAAVEGISAEQLKVRISPGKWSVLEVVCHIADSEVIYAERIRRVIAEDDPTLFNLEPDDFERTLAYNSRDVSQELSLISAIRGQTGRILRSIPTDVWQRTGIHSTDGPFTLRQLVERITNHLPHHIAFINEKRAALAGRK
jgi:uncharacterized damage-inducible protein DinB